MEIPSTFNNLSFAQYDAAKVEEGILNKENSFTGDMKKWIDSIKSKEALDPTITANIGDKWPAVQALVEAQKTQDHLAAMGKAVSDSLTGT